MLKPSVVAAFLTGTLLAIGCTRMPVVSYLDPPADLAWSTTDELPVSTPEEQGISSRKLASAVMFAKTDGLNVHSITVVRNGRVVLDTYFHPFTAESLHDIASCTKSITSTLVGIAHDKGLIPDIHAPVVSFFDKTRVAALDARKLRLKIDDLLTMRSSFASPPGLDADIPGILLMMNSPDWIKSALDRPLSDEPGKRWQYCSPCSHLLAGIVQRVSGVTPAQFADANLFGPLGIRNYQWPADPQGVNHGWGDLMMRPRDMARIGMLMLYGGRWGGRQIVSSEWVRAATTPYVNVPPHGPLSAYGYQWWIGPKIGAYSAVGRGGQYITVIPALAMVIVLTSNSSDVASGAARAELFFKRLFPAVVSSRAIAPDSDGYAELVKTVEGVARPVVVKPVLRQLPELALQIDRRTIRLDENPLQIKGFALKFKSDGSEVAFSMEQGGLPPVVMSAGLDGVKRFSPGRNGLTAAATGEWLDDHTFNLDLDELGNISHFHFTLRFDGDQVAIDVTEENGIPPLKLAGKLLEKP